LKLQLTKYKFAINIVSSLVVLFVSAIINFFLSPYIIKTIGEEANGYVQLANNFVTYASLITIALNSMASRFVSLYYNSGDKNKAEIFYASTFYANILIILVLSVFFGYVLYNLENFINIYNISVFEVKVLLLFVIINFFLSQIASILTIYMFVVNKIYYYNVLTMIGTILRAILLYVCFFLYGSKIYFITFTSCILSIFLILIYIYLKRKSSFNLKISFNKFKFYAVKQLISSGIWNTINQCGNILMTGTDLLIANWFIGATEMGILAISKTIPTYIIQVAQSINTSITPGLLISFTKGKDELIFQLNRMIKISSLILVVPITIFCIYSFYFYSLWVPTINPLKLSLLSILSIFYLIPLSGTQILYNVFTVENKLKLNSITFLITGILNILLVYLLTKYTSAGIYAIAGTSTILTFFRNIIFLVPYATKLIGLKWNYFYKSISLSLLCCVITILCSLPCIVLLEIKTWGILIISILITLLVSFLFSSIIILGKREIKSILTKIYSERKKL